nr:hypothetical protein CFP56_55507 [Quercus suber]
MDVRPFLSVLNMVFVIGQSCSSMCPLLLVCSVLGISSWEIVGISSQVFGVLSCKYLYFHLSSRFCEYRLLPVSLVSLSDVVVIKAFTGIIFPLAALLGGLVQLN